MGKKKFIDKNKSQRFFVQTRNCDSEDEEAKDQPIDEKRILEQSKYGVYYEDNYNYLKHLVQLSDDTRKKTTELVQVQAPEELEAVAEEPARGYSIDPTGYFNEEFQNELDEEEEFDGSEEDFADLLPKPKQDQSETEDEEMEFDYDNMIQKDSDDQEFSDDFSDYEEEPFIPNPSNKDELLINKAMAELDNLNLDSSDKSLKDIDYLERMLGRESRNSVPEKPQPLDEAMKEKTLKLSYQKETKLDIVVEEGKFLTKGCNVYTNEIKYQKFNPISEDLLEILNSTISKRKEKKIPQEKEEDEIGKIVNLSVENTTRTKNETKEEKALRKQAVKQHNKERREQKKTMKLMFKDGVQKMKKQQSNNPVFVKLG